MSFRSVSVILFAMIWAVAAKAGTLDTPAQLERERTILQVLKQPGMRTEIARVEALYAADPRAKTASGKATIKRAAHAIGVQSIHYALMEEASRSDIIWTPHSRHKWHGMDVPNSGYGIENPDNIYQVATVVGGGKYIMHGRWPKPGPVQFHVEVRDSLPGLGQMAVEGFRQLATLQSEQMKIAEDGGFVLHIDSDPPGDRENHLAIPKEGVLQIGIRQLLTDWAAQAPIALRMERVDAQPTPMPRDYAVLAARSAVILDQIAPYWLDYNNRYIYPRVANIIAPVRQRPGGRGLSTSGHYDLKGNEALLIQVDPLGAMSFGMQVTDPWGVAYDYAENTSSLNNSQAKIDAQGLMTFVISAKDPGVANWLDSGGRSAGLVTLRWQGVPQAAPLDQAVRQVKIVTLAQLDPSLARVSRKARAQERQKRYKDYTVRLVH